MILRIPWAFFHFFFPGGTGVLHVDIDQPVFDEHARLVEKVLDHLEKARVFGFGDVLQTFRDREDSLGWSTCMQLMLLANSAPL